jgi:hypothetical protein
LYPIIMNYRSQPLESTSGNSAGGPEAKRRKIG